MPCRIPQAAGLTRAKADRLSRYRNAQAGQVIALPGRRIDRPKHDFLEWHLDEVFKAP